MAGKVKVKIDGKMTEVPEGINLIEAARLAGVHIPNLCYLKGMKGIGACRLCLVEVEGAKAPVIACNTKVKDGMKINTATEPILEARKFVIDLIVSMHPLDCMTCTKAGVCSLQNYAYQFGIKEASFTRKKFGYPTDESNPFIKRDPDYCVLCGRCVRACRENGTNVLDFMGRGVGSRVVTANDRPMQESGCTFCGTCVDVCPVNAFLEADRWQKGRDWEFEKTGSVCLLCGDACDIKVSARDGRVAKVNAGGQAGSVNNYICALGRFGFDCIEADSRLAKPMKRVGDKLEETTWEDAVSIAAAALKRAGADSGFVASASVLNEDAMALSALAKATGSKNVASSLSLYADEESLKGSSAAELEGADVILVAGLAPDQWKRVLPALDAAIRRSVQRGAKLIVVDSRVTRLSEAASAALPGEEVYSIKSFIKALGENGLAIDKNIEDALAGAEVTDEANNAARIFAAAKNPVIFSSPALFGAVSNIAAVKAAPVIAVPLESNARGVALAGLEAGGKGYHEMSAPEGAGLKALLVLGDVPIRERPKTDFLIVVHTHLGGLASKADLALPAAAFLEAEGSIVDYMGRLKWLPKAITPQGEARSNFDILASIAGELGGKIRRPSEADVEKLSKSGAPKPGARPFEKKSFDVSEEDFTESVNAGVINGSRLLWLKETEKAIRA